MGMATIACRVAMRANSTGPPCSAAFVSSSTAVRTTRHFVVRLGDGLAEMDNGSRSVDSFPPSASVIGSAKRRDQDTTQPRNRTGIQAEL